MIPQVINVIGMQPRDVYVLFEMSRKNLVLLIEALRRCEISINKLDSKEVAIEDCFVSFFNQINELEKQLGEQYGPPSNPE